MLFVGTSIIHPSTDGVFLLCNILDLLIYRCMLKNGLSLSLSKLLKDNYRQYVDINISRSTVIFSDDLLAAMAKNEENNILIYEVENCM